MNHYKQGNKFNELWTIVGKNQGAIDWPVVYELQVEKEET